MPPKRQRKPKPGVIVLPTEITPARTMLHQFMMLWYGVEKVGKTVLASKFPGSLFLFFEQGGKALNLFSMLMRDWVEFRKTVKLLTTTKHEYKNIVIDTGDIAYDRCLQQVCIEMAIDHPSDEEYGKGWGAVKAEFNKQILELNNSGLGIVILSHQTIKSIKSRRGSDEHHRIQPSLSKQALSVIEPMVDVYAYMHFDSQGNRQIQMVGDELIAAGHRLGDELGRFKYADGSPILQIPMGANGDEAYKNFVDAFNNELGSVGGKKRVTKKKVTKKKVTKKKASRR